MVTAVLRFASYIYVLRAPLLTALVLLLLPAIGLRTSASAFLAGLFDVHSFGMALVALIAFTTAWTLMVTSWLILAYGSARFHMDPVLTVSYPLGRRHVAIFALFALPVVIETLVFSRQEMAAGVLLALIWAVAGFLGALVLLLCARRTAGVFQKLLTSQDANGLVKALQRLVAAVAARPNLGEGYIDYQTQPPVLHQGHVLALLTFLASFGVYGLVGIIKSFWIGYQTGIPTLAYVLLLLMLICWAVGALSFFFDRYRVPVLVPLLLLPTIASLLPQSDHYYRVRPGKLTDSPPPEIALTATGRDSAIVVAAEGGGIQSAAWAARVLTGLEQKCRRECGSGQPTFGQSIRFISAVSGGSVGATYFVARYDSSGQLPADDALEKVVETAQTSSLDAVAWGLVYPDLLRTFVPFFKSKHADRGQALEDAWTRTSELTQPLSHWREGARSGRHPAVALNSTIADTGERLLFATSKMRRVIRGRKHFDDLYADVDISIVTAARLSATFPYVSPAARADLGGAWTPQVHVVDGGYYDNYGMVTLTEWLDEALAGAFNRVRRILVLQLRGSPPTREGPVAIRRGWVYQTFAPLSTMLNVRRAGQLSHNEAELSLLKEAWRLKGVTIDTAIFQFCAEEPPLSWHLTERQKREIESEWNLELTKGTGWPIVRSFVMGTSPPAPPRARRCE